MYIQVFQVDHRFIIAYRREDNSEDDLYGIYY